MPDSVSKPQAGGTGNPGVLLVSLARSHVPGSGDLYDRLIQRTELRLLGPQVLRCLVSQFFPLPFSSRDSIAVLHLPDMSVPMSSVPHTAEDVSV